MSVIVSSQWESPCSSLWQLLPVEWYQSNCDIGLKWLQGRALQNITEMIIQHHCVAKKRMKKSQIITSAHGSYWRSAASFKPADGWAPLDQGLLHLVLQPHLAFCFFFGLFLGSTGNTRRHVSGQTMRNIRNARPLEGSRVIFACLARVSNLYSLTSSSFFQSCHFQLKSYLVKQKSHKKVEKANSMRKRGGNKRIFKVVMFDLEKMPTNPLWISVWN